MGDRTWFNITFAKRDLEKFNEVLKSKMWDGTWWDDLDEDGNRLSAQVDEANYGWYSEVEQLVDAGLNFTAEHGDGGDYGPACYVSYEDKYEDVQVGHNLGFVVSVNSDGTVDQKALDAVKRYRELCEKVDEYIKSSPPPAEKKYQWADPYEWLVKKLPDWEFGGTLGAVALSLAGRLDHEAIKDLFMADMEKDGYFIPVEEGGTDEKD